MIILNTNANIIKNINNPNNGIFKVKFKRIPKFCNIYANIPLIINENKKNLGFISTPNNGMFL